MSWQIFVVEVVKRCFLGRDQTPKQKLTSNTVKAHAGGGGGGGGGLNRAFTVISDK